MNLRVVTEILRIFSQSNERMIKANNEELKKMMLEQDKKRAEQEKKHEAAIQGVRQEIRELGELVRSQGGTQELVNKLNERFTGFLDDIDRQAQAHLQAELAAQPSGSDHFAPTSNTR